MNIEQRTVGDVMILTIDGDILMTGDEASPIAHRVRSELQQGHTRFLLDLGRVRYVDSTGLGELVQTYSAVRNRGGVIKLVNVTKRVNDLLVLTRLLTVFDCHDTETEALASFAEQPSARVDAGRLLSLAVAIVGGTLLLASPVAAQVGPSINSGVGTSVMEGTVVQGANGTDELFVVTFSGARHAFHAVKGLIVHGSKGSRGDDLTGLHAGETVAVHYSVSGDEQTVHEVDRIGVGGLSMAEGIVIGINRRRQEIVIRFDEHRTDTFKLTERASQDVGHDLDGSAGGSVRVTVYYSDEAGVKVAHYFKKKG